MSHSYKNEQGRRSVSGFFRQNITEHVPRCSNLISFCGDRRCSHSWQCSLAWVFNLLAVKMTLCDGYDENSSLFWIDLRSNAPWFPKRRSSIHFIFGKIGACLKNALLTCSHSSQLGSKISLCLILFVFEHGSYCKWDTAAGSKPRACRMYF